MICRTSILEWNCSLATSIVEIFLSFGRREVYVDHAIMTLSGSQPTCFRFISVGDPDYIYLHFLFERTTITKSYGRTLWQLLQLAKSLTTWSQSYRHHHRYCHHKIFIVHPYKESYGGRWWGSKAQGWWKSISRLGWGLRTYWRVWDGEKLMHRSMKQGILLLFNMIIYGNNSCFFMGLYVRRSDRR